MNRSILPGVIFILGGMFFAILPQFILPVCENLVATASGGNVPMKCFWTARAEVGAGAMAVLGGLLYCTWHDAGSRFGIAAMTAGAALLAVAIPTVLVGVCSSEAMACRVGTLPALVLTGMALFIAAVVVCLTLLGAMKKKCRR